ncbi:MAG TPA: hypothetical protein VMM13_17540 [Euzebya sp.]|nr:hypothetical protein [Euzebya sp.]
MTPSTWADVTNYVLLALGAAMFLGTGLALRSFRRNGVFPGQPVDEDGTPLTPPSLRAAWVKIALGLIIGLYGLAGLTTGTLIGT